MVSSIFLVIAFKFVGAVIIILTMFMAGWFARSCFVEDEKGFKKMRRCGHKRWIVTCKDCGYTTKEVQNTQEEIHNLTQEFEELYDGDLEGEAISLLLTELRKLAIGVQYDSNKG